MAATGEWIFNMKRGFFLLAGVLLDTVSLRNAGLSSSQTQRVIPVSHGTLPEGYSHLLPFPVELSEDHSLTRLLLGKI